MISAKLDPVKEFLGDLPSGWRKLPLKRCVSTKVTDGPHETPELVDDGVPFVSAEAVRDGRIDFDRKRGFIRPELHAQYVRKCRPCRDDIFLCKSGATTGKLAYVDTDAEFSVWSPLALIRAERGTILPRFLYSVLHADYVQDQVRTTWSFGTQPNIAMGVIEQLLLAVPPLSLQQKLLDFLDRKTVQIDALIAKKQRMIELLGEKRQALISQAVTRGLNPNVPMKDSGIEWLGMIPRHWEVVRVKHVLRGLEQGWSPECESREAEDSEWGVLKAGCVNYGVLNESENKALPAHLAPIRELEVKSGDVLVSRASGSPELVGSAAIVEAIRSRLLLCDKLYRLHAHPVRILPAYLAASLNSLSSRVQIEQAISGAEGLANNITQPTVRNMVIVLPPLVEQHRIVRALDSGKSQINRGVSLISSQIDRLREYRQTLISAAVTGKIDLRKEGHGDAS